MKDPLPRFSSNFYMMDEKRVLMEPAPIRAPGTKQAKSKHWGVVRNVVLIVFLGFSLRLFLPTSWSRSWDQLSFGKLSIEERAKSILDKNPLIDGHNDLLILVRFLHKNHIYGSGFKEPFENGGFPGHFDLPRLQTGKQGGAFWSAFLPCPENVTDFSDENYAPYVRATLEQIDAFHRLAALYPKVFTPTPSYRSALRAFKAGNLISPLAIEGLHQIGNSLSTLRLYHSLGVRYATLTWNCHNIYADAAVIPNKEGEIEVATPLWHGLSPAGAELIHEMNRMGMIVDLSHVSPETMRDTLVGNREKNISGSAAPPIFSHSSAHALCPHPRNVPDEILHLVKERISLVMVNFSPDFVSCTASNSSTGIPDFYPKNSTLEHVVSHIMHIGDLIGYDYVGIGTDYDGIQSTPRGLEDVSKFPDLVAELLRRGVSEEDCAKIVGRNLLRVWKEVDEVAARLQQLVEPLEDDIQFLTRGDAMLDAEFGAL